MPLPKRASPYIVAFLLVVLGVLVWFMFTALNSPELERAIQEKKKQSKAGTAEAPEPSR